MCVCNLHLCEYSWTERFPRYFESCIFSSVVCLHIVHFGRKGSSRSEVVLCCSWWNNLRHLNKRAAKISGIDF